MVLTNRSQIPQFTKRFFYQSWPFKCFQNTTFGINKIFNFRFEITIYGIALIRILKDCDN